MDKSLPKVAVITRTKNRPILLRRCVESVLNQRYENWVHVIVNDGGDSEVLDSLLKPFEKQYGRRLKVIHNPSSTGMQNASNLAIKSSDSEYVAIHDDDDSWEPEFLEKCVEYLDRSDNSDIRYGVATQILWVFEKIFSEDRIEEVSRCDYYPFTEVSLFEMAGRNRFPPIAFVYRRVVHNEIGYFNQEFNELGDWDFHLRFLMKHDIGVLSERLALYHWRKDEEDAAYGNTVTSGLEAHLKNDLKMRNHYLRSDLQSNQMGLGFLINVARKMNENHNSAEDGGGVAGNDEFEHARLNSLLVSSSHFKKMTGDLSAEIERITINNRNHAHHIHSQLSRLIAASMHFERITSDLAKVWRFKALLRQILLYIRRRLKVMKRLLTPRHYRGSEQNTRLRRELERGGEVLSVDVFDTALIRKANQPVDVFLFIQNDVRQLLGEKDLDFPKMRRAAESLARKQAGDERGLEDISIGDIYDRFCEMATVKTSKKRELVEIEIAAERLFCCPNPHIRELCRSAKDNGWKVVFSSDMYLSKEVIRELLERGGYQPDDLLVSSEEGKAKHTGALYDTLLSKYGCRPDEVMHIGDNLHSDYVMANEKGLRAFHYDTELYGKPFIDQLRFKKMPEDDLISSVYTGLVRQRRVLTGGKAEDAEDFWRSVGYEIIGPLYLAFITWTIKRSAELGVKKLFFLARDGCQLIKVFNRLREEWGLKMEAEYMLSSRRLLNFPRIVDLEADSLEFLLAPNPCMSVKHFLQRAGIDPALYADEISRLGFSSPEQIITTPDGGFILDEYWMKMRNLLKMMEHEIIEKSEYERGKLFEYFDDIGFAPNEIAVVDVGWQASSVKSLRELLVLRGQKCALKGFYFGTWHFAESAVNAGAKLESFFLHMGKPDWRAGLIAESVELLESFFWAPYSSITGIEKDGEHFKALYGEKELTDEISVLMELAVESAFSFIDDALEVLPDMREYEPPFSYLEGVMERLFRYPSENDARVLGQITHRTGFGGYGPIRPLAKLPSAKNMFLHLNALQDAYDHCFWKKGFLSQLNPKESELIIK